MRARVSGPRRSSPIRRQRERQGVYRSSSRPRATSSEHKSRFRQIHRAAFLQRKPETRTRNPGQVHSIVCEPAWNLTRDRCPRLTPPMVPQLIAVIEISAVCRGQNCTPNGDKFRRQSTVWRHPMRPSDRAASRLARGFEDLSSEIVADPESSFCRELVQQWTNCSQVPFAFRVEHDTKQADKT